jgi:hypothetical protein
MCPLGLRNELNVECPSRVRLQLVSQNAKFMSRVLTCAAAAVCCVRRLQQIAVMSACASVDVDKHKQRVRQQRNSSYSTVGCKARSWRFDVLVPRAVAKTTSLQEDSVPYSKRNRYGKSH